MTDSIDSRFQRGPNPGGPGNPGGVYNTAPQIRPGYYGQQANQGRYRPPTLGGDGSNPGNWNDFGGYSYNVPNHYGVGSGWQSPGLSPFPQFAQSLEQINAQRTRQRLRPLSPYEVATGRPGATIAGDRPNSGRASDTRYAGGSSDFDESTGLRRSDYPTQEAYEAAWTAARNATPNFSGWIGAYQQGLAGEAPPTRGSPYLGPRETHVGGPNDQPKQPAAIDGGVKGPAAAPDIREPLDDWQWRAPRFRGRRWGRY